MHFKRDIMLKRSSITTAFDHFTHSSLKVTKSSEHHCATVIIMAGECGNHVA